MFSELSQLIATFSKDSISSERQEILNPLVAYIQTKKDNDEPIRLNFICTHNSRRSHLTQIWAQTMAFYFKIENVYCYSGGTEVTAMFPKIVETLVNQGFHVHRLCDTENPVYAVKYDENESPLICFSKNYHDPFNPKSNYGAIMTCNHADEGCPMVLGAEERFPITYEDPKTYDQTNLQTEMYAKRSLEIAQEIWWVFNKIVSKNL